MRAATGRRAGRVVASSNAKQAKNQHLQQGALAVMRASTGRFSIMKGRQVGETKKLLVSGGFRGRDAIVVFTFFKLVAPLVFLAAAALFVYGTNPIGKGGMLDAAAVVAAALVGSKLPDYIVKKIRDKRLTASARRCPTRSTCW